ncbi:MAG TPA: radical SAM protein, partial [Microbacterium sp.]|uniref:radical SAM protein n=1 Tax=Microbacterium sp. TaxID=51671 RepID=UPI002B492ACC
MGSALPEGEPAPDDGSLPDEAVVDAATDFGVYLHVPFCRVRCGYCDFNTYTSSELRGARQDQYADTLLREVDLARTVLAARGPLRPAATVFFGGGTPTLLPPSALGAILRAIDAEFGLAPGAEVTTEANPESVDEASLSELRA